MRSVGEEYAELKRRVAELEGLLVAEREASSGWEAQLHGLETIRLRDNQYLIDQRDAAIARAERSEAERDEALEALKRASGERHDEWRAKVDAIAALQRAEADNAALRGEATRASAELRHTYRPETRDWNLVARAIVILETVTTPDHPGAALLEYIRALEKVREAAEPFLVGGGRETLVAEDEDLRAACAAADALKERKP